MPAWSGPSQLSRGWPRDAHAAPLPGTPCHPDPHLPPDSPLRRSSAPALSAPGTPSPLLPPRPGAPTQLPVPGAGPFAGRTCAGSLRWDLAAGRPVSAERTLGSAPPPARRAGPSPAPLCPY